MANKRQLKKYIRFVCGSVAAECMMASEFIEDMDREKMNHLIVEVAMLQENALDHASFSFDKVPADYTSKREYNTAKNKYYSAGYQKLHEEFNSHIQGIVKQMNALLSDEQREMNKKIAAGQP